jgi:hypothetical protein
MPVLRQEPFVYPASLFEEGCSGNDDARWWVFHTKPRAEKMLASALLHRHVPFFLPLSRKQRPGRLPPAYLPLFPGYVFMFGDNAARIQALTSNKIARVLAVTAQDELRSDLARLHSLFLSGASLMPEERLQPGSPVAITSGPLAGMEGKILRRGKRWRFFVEIRFLQQGASVELDHWMIEPLNDRPSFYQLGA